MKKKLEKFFHWMQDEHPAIGFTIWCIVTISSGIITVYFLRQKNLLLMICSFIGGVILNSLTLFLWCDNNIAGGGRSSYYLAKALIEDGIRVKILEKERDRCESLAELIPEATIVQRFFVLFATTWAIGIPMTQAMWPSPRARSTTGSSF